MKRFLSMTVSVPLWLVLLIVTGAFTHIASLNTAAIEKWKEAEKTEQSAVADTAKANARSCDDYLRPGVKLSNLSSAQQANSEQCFKLNN